MNPKGKPTRRKKRRYTQDDEKIACLLTASAIASIMDASPPKLTNGMRLALVDIATVLRERGRGIKRPVDILEILTGKAEGRENLPESAPDNETVIDLADYFPGGDYADEAALPLGNPGDEEPCPFCGFPIFVCTCELGLATRADK